MSTEHEHWLRDQEAERQIRLFRDAIREARGSEGFAFRAGWALPILEDLDERLAEDAAHIVAVWD